MKIGISIFTVSILLSSYAQAEYCEDQFYKDIAASNTELAKKLLWQKENQDLALRYDAAKNTEQSTVAAILSNTTLSPEAKLAEATAHTEVITAIQKKLDEQVARNSVINKEINEMRNTIPVQLRDKAGKCAAEMAPYNMLVNFAVQGLAMVYSDGASIILPEKALYVDMGEVLHGNVMGGPTSAPNEIKDWINGRCGIHL